MADNDNRIALPPTAVDFSNVGVTGQAHDEFPKPGQQPRYDWMRSYLIGLLSMQSSIDEPTQYRVGTPWFDKNTNTLKIWSGSEWARFDSVIGIDADDTSLATKLAEVETALSSVHPKMTYSGHCVKNNTTQIPVPDTIITALGDNTADLKPVVYINGLQMDPRKTNFVAGCPSVVILSGGLKLTKNDRFTVMIERLDVFVLDEVVAG